MAVTYSGRQINAVISVEDAMAYVNNEAELLAVLKDDTYVGSWVKEAERIGGNRSRKVSYRKFSFEDLELGTYDTKNGYPDKNHSATWIEKELTQEKGNVLTIDVIDSEASIGGDIVSLHNQYTKKIKIPAISKYTFGQIVAGATNKDTTALTKDNIVKTIFTLLTQLEEKGVTIQNSELELRITPTAYSLLVEAGYDKGSFSINGTPFAFGNEVSNVGGVVKIIKVPTNLMGTASLVLAPTEAVAVTFLLDEAVYHDKVAGHGTRKKQVDEGIVYDAWIVPGWEDYVFVNATA